MTTMPHYVEFDPDGEVVLILYNMAEDRGQDTRKTPSESTTKAETSADVVDGTQPDEIRMRVSSRHLTLASLVFKSLLKGEFAESRSLKSAGTAEVRLPEDNPQALQILLNIIHSHSNKVPREVNIDTLTQMSILIDKYCLHEATQIFTDMWFDKLKRDIPDNFTNELMSWLCVSWVLGKPESFKAITKIAARESEGHLEGVAEIGLPIPIRVLDAIAGARLTALAVLSHMVDSIEHEYGFDQGRRRCCREKDCDAMVLGGFIRALMAQNLWPFPYPPYSGHSVKKLADKFHQMSLPSLCLSLRSNIRPTCGLKTRTDHVVSIMEQQLHGLELDLMRLGDYSLNGKDKQP